MNRRFLLRLLALGAGVFGARPLASAPLIGSGGERRRIDGRLRLAHTPFQGSVDPSHGEYTASAGIITLLFRGLTTLDPVSLEAAQGLADRWETSEDGRRYLFHLGDAPRWSDGAPLTAEDVVWSWKRPVTAQRFARYLRQPDEAGDLPETAGFEVRALDGRSLEVRLERPHPLFPVFLSLPPFFPVPRHLGERDANWASPVGQAREGGIVGSGPYRLRRWRSGDILELERNPHYPGPTPALAPIEIREVASDELATELFEAGEIDFVGVEEFCRVPPQLASRLIGDPRLEERRHIRSSLTTRYLAFNPSRAPMDNALVRRAMGAAIKRQAFLSKHLGHLAEPARSLTPPVLLGLTPGEERLTIPNDVARARAWLAQAGYATGKDLGELRLLAGPSANKDELALLGRMLREALDVSLRVERVDDEEALWANAINGANQDHHFAFLSFSADYQDPRNFLFDALSECLPMRSGGWDVRAYHAMMAAAAKLPDRRERLDRYREIEVFLLRTEAVILPLYRPVSLILSDPALDWRLAPAGVDVAAWRWRS